VTDPHHHDPVDAWLDRDVTPLMPPAGSLDRIRRTARGRKRAQAIMAAAGCAVVVAGAAVVPRLVSASHGTTPATAGPPIGRVATSSAKASPARTGTKSPEVAASSPLAPQRSLLSAANGGAAVPAHFRPTSVTFVGSGRNNGLVGAVIGQAGPKCATQYCTSLAQTPNYGANWYGLSAPLTGGPQGATGVSQVRFTNLTDGWAYGPSLWETTSGGWPWQAEDTFGMRVTDLEAVGQRAFAIFASCAGDTASYASDCTSFSLYTSVAGSATWTPAPVPAAFQSMTTSAPSSASLVLGAAGTGYLLTPSGEVLSGPVTGGAWTEAGKAPCVPGSAQDSGIPAGAQLTAATSSLAITCDSGDTVTVYTSATGAKWAQAGVLHAAGAANSLASTVSGELVLATTGGIYYSADGGKTWQLAAVSGPAGQGFSYVGMTNTTQGVALPADADLGEVFVTTNGARTWTASPVRSQ
jgi:hypothetical protein